MSRLLVVVGFLVTLVTLAILPIEGRAASDTATVIASTPLQVLPLVGDNPSIEAIISVRINGKGPFNLLVDTGADKLALKSSVIKQLRLKVKHVDWASDADSVSWQDHLYDSVVVNLGRINLKTSCSDMQDNIGGIDGMLGGPLFQAYAVQIDVADKELKLFDESTYTETSNAVILRIGLDTYHRPIISGVVEGSPTILTLDTGCGIQLLADSAVIASVIRDDPPLGVQGASSAFTNSTYDVHLVKTVTVGDGKDLIFSNVQGFVGAGMLNDEEGFGGRLGMPTLSQFDPTFIYGAFCIVLHHPNWNSVIRMWRVTRPNVR